MFAFGYTIAIHGYHCCNWFASVCIWLHHCYTIAIHGYHCCNWLPKFWIWLTLVAIWFDTILKLVNTIATLFLGASFARSLFANHKPHGITCLRQWIVNDLWLRSCNSLLFVSCKPWAALCTDLTQATLGGPGLKMAQDFIVLVSTLFPHSATIANPFTTLLRYWLRTQSCNLVVQCLRRRRALRGFNHG